MESFNQNVIKYKTGLLDLAAELGNISKACRIMAFPEIPFKGADQDGEFLFSQHMYGL